MAIVRFRLVAIALAILAASPFTAPFAACDLATVIGTSSVAVARVIAADTHTTVVVGHVRWTPADSVFDDAQDVTIESPLVVTRLGHSAPTFVTAIYRTIEFRKPPVTLRL